MKIRALPIVILLVISLVGCGRLSGGTVSSLELESDGTIRASSVASFDKAYYDEEELKKDIEKSVGEYNGKAGSERIALDSCTVSNSSAKVIMFYRDAEDYAAFNDVTLWSGTLSEAVIEGKAERTTQVKDLGLEGDAVSVSEILSGNGKNDSLLILQEPLLVKVPGTIEYVIGNVTIDKDGNARVGTAEDSSSTLSTPVYIIYQ